MPPVLLVGIGGAIGAIPVADIVESFRPLPVQPIRGVPAFVRGLAIVRGTPIPVVDLSHLLTGTPGEIRRFVTVRLGERRAVLGVESVRGLRTVDDAFFAPLPPLLQAGSDRVAAAGAADGGLILMLQQGRTLLDEAMRAVDASGGAA